MRKIKIISWNVNGVRAAYKKGFLTWFLKKKPEILCIQETKAIEEQLPDALKNISGYETYYESAERKGYSGVGLYTKEKPSGIKRGFGIKKFDKEGRTIIADYKEFVLFNIYFPNGKMSKERLEYKMDFYESFLKCLDNYRKKGRKLIICGDINTAHEEIDLARPKENSKNSGFLSEERAWIDKLISHGYVDTFRIFNKDGGNYTWWDLKTRARDRNVGWRIDYFFVSEDLKRNIKSSFIMSDVTGSDHCPIGIEIAVNES